MDRCSKYSTRFFVVAIVLLYSGTIYSYWPAPTTCQTDQAQADEAKAERLLDDAQRLLGEGTLTSKQEGIAKLIEAIRFWRTVDDKHHEAICLSLIGKTYDLLGEKQRALDYYTQTLAVTRASKEQSNEAATLNNIGLIYDSLGEKQKALEYYNTALALLKQTGDQHIEAITLVNIGLVHDSMGEKQKALSFYQHAIPLLQAAHDREGEAVALNNIGYLYDSIGEQLKALAYFFRAIPILHEIGDARVESITLNNIGFVYDALGEKQKALDYYNRALPVLRAFGDRRMEAVTLNNIGLVQKSMGSERDALLFLNQSLKLRRAVGDRAGEGVTLSDLGSVQALLGEDRQALALYKESLQLSRVVADKNTEATTLRRIALIQRKQGAFEEARSSLEDAVNLIEHLRSRIPGQELRASYFSSVQQFFESYINVLMLLHGRDKDAGFDVLAFQAAERARARTLLDSLTEAHARITEGAPSELLQRERTLQLQLDVEAEKQARLRSAASTSEEIRLSKQRLDELLTQYEETEAEIKTRSPRYAALTQPTPSSVTEIQQQVLDSDTLLLEYALGEEKSYLWAITPNSLESFELPSRTQIESATRDLYEVMTARERYIRFETPDQQRARITKADGEYFSKSSMLSHMLLGPIASELKKRRLLIVGDGALNYLPFAALPDPSAVGTQPPAVRAGIRAPSKNGGSASYTPLIVDHEIVSLPSASTLSVLRHELLGRALAPKILAMVADPVFERDDVRVKGKRSLPRTNVHQKGSIELKSTKTAQALSLSSSQADTDEMAEIHRLPSTRREAEAILALVPRSESLKALDFQASRATAESPSLAQYRYVHFATHGFLNTAHPELSAIVLSLVNSQGEDQQGFLWAHEVYNLHLPAEMVVLNGCRTGLGKEIRGEGLVGLTRGFMYAGSARVLVSLWNISDEASASLMTSLYKALLKEHMTPAAALRAAQLETLKQPRWRAPYYWAAFVLQGEPR